MKCSRVTMILFLGVSVGSVLHGQVDRCVWAYVVRYAGLAWCGGRRETRVLYTNGPVMLIAGGYRTQTVPSMGYRNPYGGRVMLLLMGEAFSWCACGGKLF